MFFVAKYTENTISFHSGVKMYRFHPKVEDTCKQKIFHHEAKSHPGWNNACKLHLNGALFTFFKKWNTGILAKLVIE